MPSDPSIVFDPIAFLKIYLSSDNSQINEQARAVGELILVAWCIHIVNWGFAGGGLNYLLGVRPRELTGIFGIVFAPFLHSVRKQDGEYQNSHIVFNTLYFAPLAFLIALQGVKIFYVVSLIALLFDGIGTWLFGEEGSYHIGASGVIFGYIGFLIVYGLTSTNLMSFVIGLVTLFLYRRTIPGILPTDRPNISWEGHLFGFIGGIVAAYVIGYVNLHV